MNWSIFLAAAGSASIEFLETAAIAYAIARSGYVREAIWGTIAQYLLKLPEVLIKLGAGILLTALGTFWLGEGLGFEWPFEEISILILVTAYSLAATLAIYILKKNQAATT